MKTEYTPEQIEILKAYVKITKTLKKHPSRQHMKDNGYSKDKVEYHFGSLTKLRKAAKEFDPKSFNNIVDEEIFCPKKFAKLVQTINNTEYKRFVVTTAVAGCELHQGFYDSIKNYCKVNQALLLLMPCADPAHNWVEKQNVWSIDAKLKDEYIVWNDLALNSNIWLSRLKLSAKQIDPITGLARIGSRNGSFLFASPKQRLRMVATTNTNYPHALMTTGAITKPNYSSVYYMSERTAYLADNDHVIGAIIVEIENDKVFHFRQIQAEKSGAFVDLGKRYDRTNVTEFKPKAIVLGDYHCGETDQKADSAWKEIIKELNPEVVVFHDIFDCKAVNHHNEGKIITKARLALENKGNLLDELKLVAKTLDEYSNICKKIVVVKGNHDEFLNRWLEKGTYVNDSLNHLTALKIAVRMLEGYDPLKYGVETLGGLKTDKVTWLSRNDDYKVAGIQLAAHGDRGVGGSKGNLAQMESSYGNCVTGHYHSPQILRQAYQVGTSTHLKLDYSAGSPSAWLHNSCLIYPNGSRQMINVIGGKWRL